MFVCLWIYHEYRATDIYSCGIDLGKLCHLFSYCKSLGIKNVEIFVDHYSMLCWERIEIGIKDTLTVCLSLVDSIDFDLGKRYWTTSQWGNSAAYWSSKDLKTLNCGFFAKFYDHSAIGWLEDLTRFCIRGLWTDDNLAWFDFVKLVPTIAVSEDTLDNLIAIFGRDSFHFDECCRHWIIELLLDQALNKSCLDNKTVWFSFKRQSCLGIEKDLKAAVFDGIQGLCINIVILFRLLNLSIVVACRYFLKNGKTFLISKHGLLVAAKSVLHEFNCDSIRATHHLFILCHDHNRDHDSIALEPESQIVVTAATLDCLRRGLVSWVTSYEDLFWLEEGEGGALDFQRELGHVLDYGEAVAVGGAWKCLHNFARAWLNYLQSHFTKF